MYEDCVERFNCNRAPGHCSPICYRPIGQHKEPGVDSYKCCTCTPEVVEVFPMDRIWEGPAGRDGKDGSSLEFAWEGTRLKVRVKGTEEWVYSTSLLGMQGPKGDTGEKGETGAIGPRGYTGAPGQDGAAGEDGNGIDHVELYSTSGLIKTYRMYFTDGTYFAFTVTDGINGITSYNDLPNKPKINNVELSGNKSLSDLGIKQTYNKADVGLNNVDNVRQYSANNPPPYPVTSVNGQTGAVVIDTHDDLIPTQASSSNQLADKNFVNSSIGTATATFRGTYNSLAELEQVTADENDYGFVVSTDSAGNTVYNRYKYASGTWVFEYALNNSSFTQAQWETIQSGITSALVTKLQGIEDNAEVNIVEGLKIGNTTQEIDNKIIEITPDTTPVEDSTNVIESNAVYELENMLPTDTTTGDIDNAQPYKVLDIVADGKYQQDSTSGYNILPITIESGTYNGVKVTKNSDGGITLNGTSDANFKLNIYNDTTGITLNGYYTFYLIGKNSRINLQATIDGTDVAIIPFAVTSESITKNYSINANLTNVFSYLVGGTTFNNETFYYMMIVGNDTSKSYEPYTGGIPSPNPDYPQPITQVTSATWNRTGKNLFDKSTAIDGKRLGSDGMPFNDSTYCLSDFFNIVASTSYTYSRYSSGGGSAAVCFYDNNKVFISRIMWDSQVQQTQQTQTFTTPANANYLRITDLKTLKDNMQVELGTSTSYSPYQGQTIPIDLDGNEVCSVGTIKDKVLVDRYGNVALQKNVGKVVLNGSENWNCDTTKTLTQVFQTKKADMRGFTAKSNMFIYQLPGDVEKIAVAQDGIKWYIYIAILKTRASTVEEFKTWLSTHNTTVYYVLTTPQIIPLPKLSILPSTLKGINHIWVDTNLGRTDIEVEYVEDLSLAIPTKTSELTNDSGYVKNTDYATSSVGGVVKVQSTNGLNVSNQGFLFPTNASYANYQNAIDTFSISKGTLENVLTNRIGTIETALTTLDVGGGVQ